MTTNIRIMCEQISLSVKSIIDTTLLYLHFFQTSILSVHLKHRINIIIEPYEMEKALSMSNCYSIYITVNFNDIRCIFFGMEYVFVKHSDRRIKEERYVQQWAMIKIRYMYKLFL